MAMEAISNKASRILSSSFMICTHDIVASASSQPIPEGVLPGPLVTEPTIRRRIDNDCAEGTKWSCARLGMTVTGHSNRQGRVNGGKAILAPY
jgi:hypothetical protein